MPLTDCVENADVDMSQYREPAVAEVTSTTSVRVAGVLQQPDHADQQRGARGGRAEPRRRRHQRLAGLSNLAKATAVVDGGTVTRIGFDPKIPEFLPLWAKANGVDLLSEDGTEANLDDPAVVERSSTPSA